MNDKVFSVFAEEEKEEKKEKKENGEGKAIGREEVRAARGVLSRYKAAKGKLEKRIEDNERWFRMRHWEEMRHEKNGGNKSSAWLFNSIVNKHADFMDATPQCTVLPREESDVKTAEALTSVIPVILERNNWEGVYSDAVYAKLKTGTAVYSVLWDPAASGGLGDISVRQTDILNLYWEPGVRDIQKSRNVFFLEAVDNDLLTEQYPFLEGKLGGTGEVRSYVYDETVDTSDKSTVVDWYYKKKINGRTVLHYCKFVGEEVLYASENDETLRGRGWYDHTRYPFVLDPLFQEEGTPVGFGFIDIMKEAQEEIDILGNEILRNARMGARRRYFTRNEGAINEEEFADFSKDFVHVSGSSLGEDSIREITASPLSPVYVTVLNNKITELKETSGNRDFVSGGTAGGVTSGTAISALQEAGTKLSRDMIAATYRAFSAICSLTVELIRQFYSVPRSMRILGENGEWIFTSYDNSALRPVPDGRDFGLDFGQRVPVFDMSIRAHKASVFSRAAQNSDAVNFYNMGFFDPARAVQSLACLQMIDIDNKEKLTHIIEENGRKYGGLISEKNAASPVSDPTLEKILGDRKAAAARGDVSP